MKKKSSLEIEGVKFRIVLKPAKTGFNSEVSTIGQVTYNSDGDNIWIDSRLTRARRDEVLLHEILHVITELDESQVGALASRLFGVLVQNGLWRSPKLG